MRSEKEIQAMISLFKRNNASIEKQLLKLRNDAEGFDTLAALFNDNAKLLCALTWVLGENTITIRSEGSENELERGRR